MFPCILAKSIITAPLKNTCKQLTLLISISRQNIFEISSHFAPFDYTKSTKRIEI